MSLDLAGQLAKAKELAQNQKREEAAAVLRAVIDSKDHANSDVVLKLKEKAIIRLGKIFVQKKEPNQLAALLRQLRGFLTGIPKAKAAKLVRALVDLLGEIHGTEELVVELCVEHINWANEENGMQLRQRLELKLARTWHRMKSYKQALDMISKLIREVKKLDDKPMMVEVHLLESKINHGLANLSKARASLTAARTAANSIYCPPALQADLDTVSGILHCDEKDYKTAYSYFFESFENYNHTVKEKTVDLHTSSDKALLAPGFQDSQLSFKERTQLELSVNCLKYMLMCKIMTNVREEVNGLINGKLALRYATPELEAMRAIAASHSAASLKSFQAAMHKYAAELSADTFLHRHLESLYGSLLEQNLLKLIEPYSQVQVDHLAKLIELPSDQIERKLSLMILDKKLAGILDQGTGCLIVFDDPTTDSTYSSSLATISEMGKVVDSLYNKASKLS
jgi:26S proteasome regulatory subunit N6